MNDNILMIFMGSVILFFVIAALYLRKKNSPSEKDKIDAARFIDQLSTVFYNKMIIIVNTTDISNYQSVLEMESDIIGKIYDAVWDFVESEIEKASKEDILSAMALKIIDRDYVSGFCKAIIEKYKMSETLESRWAKQLEEKSSDIIKADEELKEKFSDEKLYYTKEVDNKDLKPVQNNEPTDDDIANLIPPTDDEVLLEDDDTLEVVDDTSN